MSAGKRNRQYKNERKKEAPVLVPDQLDFRVFLLNQFLCLHVTDKARCPFNQVHPCGRVPPMQRIGLLC